MESLSAFFYPSQLVLLAGSIQAVAMLFRNQIILRCTFISGTILYNIFYLAVVSPPLIEAAIVSTVMGFATLFGLVSLLLDRSRFMIRADQIPLYEAMGKMEPGAFRRLMRSADQHVLGSDTTLTQEGIVPDKLYFVMSGTVLAEKGTRRFHLPAPMFIGEIAYMTGAPASATIRVGKGAEVVEWRSDLLRGETARKPGLGLALDARIARDLAAKVTASVGPDAIQTARDGNPVS